MGDSDWVTGDRLGLKIPAHSPALRAGGEAFLTDAFRAGGVLATDNRVAQITKFKEIMVGGTGRKVLLSVTYAKAAPDLHTELFVKFSRDFDDPRRDGSRDLMEAEVRLAALSQTPGFPIAVPACLFTDYHLESGTGILITQRIAFGTGNIEPAYEKCFDYNMPEPLAHYRAAIKAVARLAGTHRAGGLAANVAQQFPFDADKLTASDRIRFTVQQLSNRTARYADFTAKFPQLLPANLKSPAFLARLVAEAPRFLAHDLAIRQFLHSNSDFIALCHWNANIDNGWFWRNAQGELECGLLDWQRVGQMSVAQALFGALCAAETRMWNDHLDELISLFASEYHASGGPNLDCRQLKLHVKLFTALMGLAWTLDAPAVIQKQVPHLSEVKDRFDPRFTSNDLARIQLQLLTVFLNAWQTLDFGAALDEVLHRSPDQTLALSKG